MGENAKLCLHNIVSSRITVVGLGISNLPLLRFLLQSGATEITARDKKDKSELDCEILALENDGVRLICGDAYLEDIDEEVIFRSPGVRPDIPQFLTAIERGALVTSEMELFFSLCPATTIAVTGSDGKTTTTTLSYELLSSQAKKCGKFNVFVGGNIGAPLLPHVHEMKEGDFAVIELSSFQLQQLRYTPDRAIITNITPNHLNWHKDYEEYIEAKTHIIGEDTHVTLNAYNEQTAKIADKTGRKTVFSAHMTRNEMHARFGDCDKLYIDGADIIFERDGVCTPVLALSDIRLIGLHNAENYMAAISAVSPFIDLDVITGVAREFRGVEHRLEFVREFKGVKYYNSSIDSSPMRTSTTLSMLGEGNIVICGGAAKGLTFELLAEALCRRARAVVLTGATALDIERAIHECRLFADSGLKIYKNGDFRGAVETACDIAHEGDTVVLSPACTSFDAFRNFEQRGNVFKDIVNGFAE